MKEELDLKRIITNMYCFEKNIKLLAGHLQVKFVEREDINLLHEWKNNQHLYMGKKGKYKANGKYLGKPKKNHIALSSSFQSDAIHE